MFVPVCKRHDIFNLVSFINLHSENVVINLCLCRNLCDVPGLFKKIDEFVICTKFAKQINKYLINQ